jgi:hypothetical protein
MKDWILMKIFRFVRWASVSIVRQLFSPIILVMFQIWITCINYFCHFKFMASEHQCTELTKELQKQVQYLKENKRWWSTRDKHVQGFCSSPERRPRAVDDLMIRHAVYIRWALIIFWWFKQVRSSPQEFAFKRFNEDWRHMQLCNRLQMRVWKTNWLVQGKKSPHAP